MNVRFVVIAPEAKRGTFNIRLPVVVGRSEEAKFRIQQDRVSRKHCEFFANGDEVFLRDLGSTNGTFLDDEQVETSVKIAVASGAVVRVGSLAFRVEYSGISDTQTTGVRRGPRDATDVTVSVTHAEESARLQIHHSSDAAAEQGETESEIPEAEFQQEELVAETAGEVVAESDPRAMPEEPMPEEPKQKAAGKGFDFLAAEPLAAEAEAENPHWPEGKAQADDAPPDDEKLGDFFKGLK